MANMLNFTGGSCLFCQAKGTDMTPLLLAPEVLHSAPKALRAGTSFQILMDKLDGTLPQKALSLDLAIPQRPQGPTCPAAMAYWDHLKHSTTFHDIEAISTIFHKLSISRLSRDRFEMK